MKYNLDCGHRLPTGRMHEAVFICPTILQIVLSVAKTETICRKCYEKRQEELEKSRVKIERTVR